MDRLDSPARITVLRALQGPKVATVFRFGVSAEINLMVSTGKLTAELGEKFVKATIEAGTPSSWGTLWNSAGATPRDIFKKHITYDELIKVLEVLRCNSPADGQGCFKWSAYAFWSLFSRKTDELLGDGLSERKEGDCVCQDRTDPVRWPNVTLRAPPEARYGKRMADRMEASYYMLASDIDEKKLANGFRTSGATGEEGRLGPAHLAQESLVALRVAVAECPVLSKIYPERWFRDGVTWEKF